MKQNMTPKTGYVDVFEYKFSYALESFLNLYRHKRCCRDIMNAVAADEHRAGNVCTEPVQEELIEEDECGDNDVEEQVLGADSIDEFRKRNRPDSCLI